MNINLNIKAALENNAEHFLKIIPTPELVISLKLKGLLTSREVEEINRLITTEERNHHLLILMLNRLENQDFYTFCKVLEENNLNVVKRFAIKLLADAKALADATGKITIISYR